MARSVTAWGIKLGSDEGTHHPRGVLKPDQGSLKAVLATVYIDKALSLDVAGQQFSVPDGEQPSFLSAQLSLSGPASSDLTNWA